MDLSENRTLGAIVLEIRKYLFLLMPQKMRLSKYRLGIFSGSGSNLVPANSFFNYWIIG